MADDDRTGTGSGRGGIYAILVVIIILLVGGILFIQQRDTGPDIEIEVPNDGPDMPDPDVDAPDVEVPDVEVPDGDGSAGGR